jgi:hypothetical protein
VALFSVHFVFKNGIKEKGKNYLNLEDVQINVVEKPTLLQA